jgi:hypothetical protein
VKPLERETPTGVFVRKVVEVTSTRGDGTTGNPVRNVVQYWSADEGDGQLLAEKDPYQAERLLERAAAAVAGFRDTTSPNLSAHEVLSAAVDIIRGQASR